MCVDITGCECHILESLIASHGRWPLPKIIQLETNHMLNPPLAYRDMCADDVWGASTRNMSLNDTSWHRQPDWARKKRPTHPTGWDLWGCSMQAAMDLVHPVGYRLLQYDWPDAVFVHAEFAAAFPCLPTHDFQKGCERARVRGKGQRDGSIWKQQPRDSVLARSPLPRFLWRLSSSHFFSCLLRSPPPLRSAPGLCRYWVGFVHARAKYSRFRWQQSNHEFVARLPQLAANAATDPVAALKSLIHTYKDTWLKRPLWIEMGVSGRSVCCTIRTAAPRPVDMALDVRWHACNESHKDGV